MNRILATFALGLSLLVSAGVQAQSAGIIKPAAAPSAAATPAAVAPAVPATATAAPAVESIDILKHNQAQRSADQPGNLSPTWRQVVSGTPNYSSLPDPEAAVLIQPKAQFPGQARPTTAGEAWRQYRNGPLTFYGGWLLVVVVIALAAVYFSFGQIKLAAPRSGRLIERFTSVERMAHWSMAISFVILAVTGLLLLFGKYVVLPVLGHTVFGWIAYAGKNVHNFVGPVFSLSVIVFFIIYVKDNLPKASDIKWIARVGGLIGKHELPSGRFNAGEKLWFWGGVVVLGLILTASGFFLNMIFPVVEYSRGNMQVANLIHLVAAVLVTAVSLGHIYMGTIGQEGAYEAMRDGYVDDTWAKEHHELWYDDVASGRVPRVRTEEGAAVVGSPVQVR
jgi:formate dehydrogenase subunit gamma